MLGVLAAVPALAGDVTVYARARAADGDGRAGQAAAGYGAALAADPTNAVIAGRAYREALEAGDDALADRAAAVLRASSLDPPDVALLRLANAINARDPVAEQAALVDISAGAFGFIAAPLAAWVAFDTGADPLPALDQAKTTPLGRRFVAETRALLMIAAGRVDEGAMALQVLLGIGDANLDVRLDAAQLFAVKGRADIARALLRGTDPALAGLRDHLDTGTAPSAAFGVAHIFLRLAADLSQGQTTPLSIALTRAALRLDPGNDRARILLATALARVGVTNGALSALDAIAADSASFAAAQDARIAVLRATGQQARALAAADARASAPGATADDAAGFGDLLSAAGRPADAARSYALALRRDRSPANWVRHLQLGGALDQAGRWSEARVSLERAVALAPDEPLALNYLGYARIERGEALAASQAMLERASRLAPDNASITDSLAWSYFLGGDAVRALPLLEKAVQTAPANTAIAEHLGDAYWAVGRRYEARYAWRAAVIGAAGGDAARLVGKISSGPPPRARERP